MEDANSEDGSIQEVRCPVLNESDVWQVEPEVDKGQLQVGGHTQEREPESSINASQNAGHSTEDNYVTGVDRSARGQHSQQGGPCFHGEL